MMDHKETSHLVQKEDRREQESSGQNELSRGRRVLVMVACMSLQAVSSGMGYGFGIMYPELIRVFSTSSTQAALVQSIFFGVSTGSGIVWSGLMKRYGCGYFAMFGSVLACSGGIISSFAPSITVVIIFAGLFAGTGMSMCYLAPFIVITRLIKKNTSIYLVFLTTGSSVGQFVIPFIFEKCISEYSWSGAFLIVSGVLLQCFVCGIFLQCTLNADSKFKERQEKLKKKVLIKSKDGPYCNIIEAETIESELESTNNTNETTIQTYEVERANSKIKGTSYAGNSLYGSHSKVNKTGSLEASVCDVCRCSALNCDKCNNFQAQETHREGHSKSEKSEDTDHSKTKKSDYIIIMSDFIVWILLGNYFIVSVSGNVEAWFITDMLLDRGYERKAGSDIVSMIGMANLIARLTAGIIKMKCSWPTAYHWLYISPISALCHGLVVYLYDYIAIFVACVVYTLFYGMTVAHGPALMLEAVGINKFPVGMAIVNVTYGVGSFVGGFLGGLIKETYGRYDVMFYIAIACSLYITVTTIIVILVMRRRQWRSAYQALDDSIELEKSTFAVQD